MAALANVRIGDVTKTSETLEENSGLLTYRDQSGTLVTCKVRYLFSSEGKCAIATLQDNDIKINNQTSDLAERELKTCYRFAPDKAALVKSFKIVIISPDMEGKVNFYKDLANKVFYFSCMIFCSVPKPEKADLVMHGTSSFFQMILENPSSNRHR